MTIVITSISEGNVMNINTNQMYTALLATFAILGFMQAKEAHAESNYERCLRDSSHKSCGHFFYVKKYKTLFAKEPSLALLATNGVSVPAGKTCRTNWKHNRKHKGWFLCSSSNFSVDEVWIEANNMAGIEDFRRVVGCWPIATFQLEIGGFFFNLETQNPNANFVSVSFGDDEGDHKEFKKGAIYATSNIVLISASEKIDDLYKSIQWSYDPITRTLNNQVQGAYTEISYHSPEQLAGCSNELKLAPVSPNK